MSSLITAEQLAETLGVSTNLVYRMATSGEIPHYRVGPRLRFNLTEVLETLRQAEGAKA